MKMIALERLRILAADRMMITNCLLYLFNRNARYNVMKKILIFALSLCMAFAFAGCDVANGNGSVDSSENIQSSETESSSMDTSDASSDDTSNTSSDSNGSAAETPPVSGSENELPLVPIS